jgi:hypothetical protein
MSVSAASGISANSTQPTSNQANFWQTFTELVGALNSNDLSGAQPVAQALNQIGQDLHNGDVTSARQTLASLQQARGGHHHHGHHAHGADASLSSQITTTRLLQGDTSSFSPNCINIAV